MFYRLFKIEYRIKQIIEKDFLIILSLNRANETIKGFCKKKNKIV